MGRFIVTRTADGVRFLLESSSGMALATSRCYKNLDACKKGIASLVADLPTVPLVDATEGKRAPNPKVELIASGRGYAFLIKAPNGKTVIASPDYATKKAARRAVSMLRAAVLDATLVFVREAGLSPLTMKKTPQRGVSVEGEGENAYQAVFDTTFETTLLPAEISALKEPVADEVAAPCVDDALTVLPTVTAVQSAASEARTEVATETAADIPTESAAKAPAAPRFVRVGESRERAGRAPSAPSRQPLSKKPQPRSTLLARILKGK